MPSMSMVQALNSAMDVLLARDPDVVIFGEGVGFYGGVFRITADHSGCVLRERFAVKSAV